MVHSYAANGGAAEEPVEPEYEHCDDDREANRELKIAPDAGQIGTCEIDRDAHDQTADDRPQRTLDPSEYRRCEGVDDDRLHHVRLEQKDWGDHDSGHGADRSGQAPPECPHPPDEPAPH